MLKDKTEKKFKDTNLNKKKFDENNQPCIKSTAEIPDQLLIYEVNGLFVHENLRIAPEEIENFRAINMGNPDILRKDKKISYFSGTLVRQL